MCILAGLGAVGTGRRCVRSAWLNVIGRPELTVFYRSSSTLDEWGDKILRAIGQLQNRLSVSNNNNYPDSSIQERQGQREDTILFPIESGGPLTSIQSILHWPVFQDKLPDLSLPSLNKPRNHGSAGKASGNTSASELKELAQYFQSHYLRMLPILSSTQLKQEITKIDEDGIEWTVESCLVLLVAALGTLCKHHGQQETVPTETYTNPDPSNWRLPSHYPELIPTSAEHSLSTTSALKYWNMAKKRLAWAMEEDNLKSAQCLCLAGSVHHSLNPCIINPDNSLRSAESGTCATQNLFTLGKCSTAPHNQSPIQSLLLAMSWYRNLPTGP